MCGKAKRIVSAYLSLYLPPFRTLIIILCKWNVCKRFLWGINTTSSQQRHLIITNEPHTLTLLPPLLPLPLLPHTLTLTQYLLLVSNSKSSQTIWPSGIRAETRDESHLAASPRCSLLLFFCSACGSCNKLDKLFEQALIATIWSRRRCLRSLWLYLLPQKCCLS